MRPATAELCPKTRGLLAFIACLHAAPAQAELTWTGPLYTVGGNNPSMVAEPGKLHLLTSQPLRYVQLSGSGSQVLREDVPGGGNAAYGFGFGPALAVASDGRAHVAYTEERGSWIIDTFYVSRGPNGGWSSATPRRSPSRIRGQCT